MSCVDAVVAFKHGAGDEGRARIQPPERIRFLEIDQALGLGVAHSRCRGTCAPDKHASERAMCAVIDSALWDEPNRAATDFFMLQASIRRSTALVQ